MTTDEPETPRDDLPAGTPVTGARVGVETRLRELRRLIRSSLALRALSLLAVATGALVLLSLGVDRLFRLPLAGRVVAQAVYLCALAGLTWKLLLRPITRRLTDRALADLVERRFPQLHDRFRSAVEFARDSRVRDASATDDIALVMKRRVVEDAARDAVSLDPGDVVDTPGVVAALTAGAIAVAAVAIIGVLASSSVETWYRRNILFEDVEWPYRTRLVVDGFPPETLERGVPRGDSLKLVVHAEGEVPARVRIRVAYARETLSANLAREGDRDFIHEHAEVAEPFTFVVEGGDFRSRPHRVLVLERPEVRSMSVVLDFPPYTAKPSQVLEGDLGEIAVPEGTKLAVRGAATKPLSGAWLETEGRRVELTTGATSGNAPDREFSGAYEPKAGGTVTIHLADTEGVPPNQWFRFLVTPVPDRLPSVIARAEGIGSLITPNARIPFKVKAADDYGVVSLGIEHEVAGENGASEKASESFPPLKTPGPTVEEEPAWEVGPLKIEPERRLDIRLFATDNDGLHGAKTGYAATQSFLVVTPERLGEEFLRREEEQRRVLERAVTEERAIRDAAYRLMDEAWKVEGPLVDAAVKEMAGLARTKRQLSRQVASITGAMRLLLEEMKNNRMGEEEELARLVNAVIDPLTDIGERLIPNATTRIGAVREMEKSADRLKEGLALAGDLETIIQRMESVLSSMKRLEGFTEVVNRLRGIIKVHDESTGEARKTYRREVISVFEESPSTAPGATPGPVKPEAEPRKEK